MDPIYMVSISNPRWHAFVKVWYKLMVEINIKVFKIYQVMIKVSGPFFAE